MISFDLLSDMDNLDKNLLDFKKGKSKTDKEEIFSRVLKFNEEVWELNSEIYLKYYPWRNKEFSQENLEWEFADVLWTLLLLAKSMDIDINKSMKNKLNKIKERWWI